MTETIQQLKEDIALLQMKLQKLEKTQMTLEKSGEFSIVSYNGETYYRNLYDGICGGWYKTDTDGEVFYLVEDETERKLEKLYQEQVVVKEPKKEQKWDVVRESVKWCEEHQNESVEDWMKPQTPEQVAAGSKEAFRESVKQGVVSSTTKAQTLYDLIADWWDEIFMNNNEAAVTIESLVDDIEKWLPKEQSAAGSQNAYVECSVEGFNDCINKIRRKLR